MPLYYSKSAAESLLPPADSTLTKSGRKLRVNLGVSAELNRSSERDEAVAVQTVVNLAKRCERAGAVIHRLDRQLERGHLLRAILQDVVFCSVPIASVGGSCSYGDGTAFTALLIWGSGVATNSVTQESPTTPIIAVGSIGSYAESTGRVGVDGTTGHPGFYPSSPEGRILTLAREDPKLRSQVQNEVNLRMCEPYENLFGVGYQWSAWLDWCDDAAARSKYKTLIPQRVEMLAVVEDISARGYEHGVLVRPIVMERQFR